MPNRERRYRETAKAPGQLDQTRSRGGLTAGGGGLAIVPMLIKPEHLLPLNAESQPHSALG
jgi:hypothetical protein